MTSPTKVLIIPSWVDTLPGSISRIEGEPDETCSSSLGTPASGASISPSGGPTCHLNSGQFQHSRPSRTRSWWLGQLAWCRYYQQPRSIHFHYRTNRSSYIYCLRRYSLLDRHGSNNLGRNTSTQPHCW